MLSRVRFLLVAAILLLLTDVSAQAGKIQDANQERGALREQEDSRQQTKGADATGSDATGSDTGGTDSGGADETEKDSTSADLPATLSNDVVVPLWVDDQVVEWIPTETELLVLEDQNPWIAVELPGEGKRRGWVRAKDLGIAEVHPVDEGPTIAPSFPDDFEIVIEDIRLPDITGSSISPLMMRATYLFVKLRMKNRTSKPASISEVSTWETQERVYTIWKKGRSVRTESYVNELVKLADIDSDDFSASWEITIPPGETETRWFQIMENVSQGFDPFSETEQSSRFTLSVKLDQTSFDFPIGVMLGERLEIETVARATQFDVPVLRVKGWLTGSGKFKLIEDTAHLKFEPYILLLDEANLGTSAGMTSSTRAHATQAIVVAEDHEFWKGRLQVYGRVVVPTQRVAEAIIETQRLGQPDALALIFSDPNATVDERLSTLNQLIPFIDASNATELMMEPLFSLPSAARAKAISAIQGVAAKGWAWEFIRRAAGDESLAVRTAAGRCLGRCEPSRAIEICQQLINDESGQVRIEALVALATLGTDESYDLLAEYCRSEEPEIITGAVGRIRTPLPERNLEILTRLALEEEGLRNPVMALLGRQKRKTIENDPVVAALATESLLQGGSLADVFYSADLAPVSDEQRDRLIAALAIPSEERPTADDANRFKYTPQQRISIARFLGHMRCVEAVDAILKLPLDGAQEKRFLPLVLGVLGDERAVEPLEQLIESMDSNDANRIPVLLALCMFGDEERKAECFDAISRNDPRFRSLDPYIGFAAEPILELLKDAEVDGSHPLSNVCYQLLSKSAAQDPEQFDRIARLEIPLTRFSSSLVTNRLAHEPDLESRYQVFQKLSGAEYEVMFGRFLRGTGLGVSRFLITPELERIANLTSYDSKQAGMLTIDMITRLHRLADSDDLESATDVCEEALTSMLSSLLHGGANDAAYSVALDRELQSLQIDGVSCLISSLTKKAASAVRLRDHNKARTLLSVADRLLSLEIPADQRISLVYIESTLNLVLCEGDVQPYAEEAFVKALDSLPEQVADEEEFQRICTSMNRLVVEPLSGNSQPAMDRLQRWEQAFRERGVEEELRATQRNAMLAEIVANKVRMSELWHPAQAMPAIKPTQGDLRRISLGKGIMSNQFILVQSMPWAEFQQFAHRVRGFGFSPLRIRPYKLEEQTLVAAILRRDYCDWGWSLEEREEQVRRLKASYDERGLAVTDLAGFYEDNAERYLIVWKDYGDLAAKRRLSVGIRTMSPRVLQPPDRDLYPASIQTFRIDPDDADRDSVIWNPIDPARRTYTSYLKGDRARLANRSSSYITIDLDATGNDDKGQMLYSILQTRNQEMQNLVLWERPLDEQLERAVELARLGYLPQAITVTERGEKASLVSTVAWVRPTRSFERLPQDQTHVFLLKD